MEAIKQIKSILKMRLKINTSNWYLKYITKVKYIQYKYQGRRDKSCTKNLLSYWKKPTKQHIRYPKILGLARIFYLIGKMEEASQKQTSSKFLRITLESILSTFLSKYRIYKCIQNRQEVINRMRLKDYVISITVSAVTCAAVTILLHLVIRLL